MLYSVPMAKIVIDARESGTSTGRYVDKLIEYLHKLRPDFEIVILAKSSRLGFFKTTSPTFKILESNYKQFTFAEQLGLLRQIRHLGADLVHFAKLEQPVLYKGRVVTSIHDLTTTRFSNPSKNLLVYKFKQLVYRWVVKKVARKSEKIMTLSEFSKQEIAQFTKVPEAKIVVAYPAADKITDAAEPVTGLKPNKFIMYVGRPFPHKNLVRLIEAFEILHLRDPQLLLALSGKTDANYERISKLVETKGLDASVVFTGFVSEGQLRWLYENTLAYVFPSLSEGFGLPGLEAMAHGAPVLSSNATCLPEIYGGGAKYFDPTDVEDMAAKISEVLGDEKLRQELIKKGLVQVKKYSWQRMAEQTLEVYKDALGIKP